MNRREFLKTALVGGGAGAVVANASMIYLLKNLDIKPFGEIFGDSQYDKSNILTNPAKVLEGGIVYDTKIRYKITNTKKEELHEGKGIGFLKGNKLLTANHVVQKRFKNFRSPFGTRRMLAETLDSKVFLENEEFPIIYENEEKDLAVIEVSEGIGKEFPFGNPNGLRRGDLTAIVGVYGGEKIFKFSRVCSKIATPNFLRYDDYEPEDMFLTWNSTSGGDSGGPVYAFRDGSPEVVGMTKMMTKNMGAIHKITDIENVLKKYL